MTTTKFDGERASIYLPISSIYSYHECLELIKTHRCVYGSIDKHFLSQLKLYMKINERIYKKRKPVFLKRLDIYLPSDYNMSYLSNHLKQFCCEMLEGLPVFAFIDYKNKKAFVLSILVCERFFKQKDTLYTVYEDHDVYQRRREGKKGLFFCRQSDDGAILVRKKGDIKYSFYSRFTYKSRIFAGNSKQFENFVELLKMKWASMLLPLGILKKQRYIQGISIKRAIIRKTNKTNIYWLKNIKLYNRIKCIINDDLTILFAVCEGMNLSVTEPAGKEVFKLFNKYKEIFKINKKIYFNRCDKVDIFMNEILECWKKDYSSTVINLSTKF